LPSEIVGQTGREFKTRYKEHIRNIKNIGQNSKFTQHILNTAHEYETRGKTMTILNVKKKGKMLKTDEKFYIKQNTQLNDNLTEIYNPIYNLIIATDQNAIKQNNNQTNLPHHIHTNPLSHQSTPNPTTQYILRESCNLIFNQVKQRNLRKPHNKVSTYNSNNVEQF
jgi:hypothetical protein